jgi:hypothetical protein
MEIGSCPNVATEFNRKHGKNIIHDTVANLTEKLKKPGSVTVQQRSDEGTTDVVLGAFARSPQERTRKLATERGVNRPSIMHIWEKHIWHP